jgi:voltage-gated potassium channel
MTRLRRAAELGSLTLVLSSVASLLVELETASPHHRPAAFVWIDMFFAAAFTVEYAVRWASSRSWRYPLRPVALLDLVTLLPFYLDALGLRALQLLRLARLLRVLRLYRYTDAARVLWAAYYRIRYEFAVIGLALGTVAVVGAALVHETERDAQPEAFGRYSDALWFVLETVTTVGYGDRVPITAAGRLATAGIMVSGLVLYGTFVSLLGGSFIDEVRRRHHQAPQPEEPVPATPPPA